MHKTRKVIALVTALLSLVGAERNAYAGLIGSPLALRGVVEQIRFNEPTLAPWPTQCSAGVTLKIACRRDPGSFSGAALSG